METFLVCVGRPMEILPNHNSEQKLDEFDRKKTGLPYPNRIKVIQVDDFHFRPQQNIVDLWSEGEKP
jgi:hypothetical protein